MMISHRDDNVQFVNPEKEVNAGLWTLLVGASIFLGLRLWCKLTKRNGLWYDDYVLVVSWLVLLATDIIITCEYATGYALGEWDDTMHILINISSCGTLLGQALSKTALGITLLRMSNRKQIAILVSCIVIMNSYMIIKMFFQWAKYCNKSDYQNWYRLSGPCVSWDFEQKLKTGGNTLNIIMDFIFAAFPWWITWSLEMRRVEKIALCGTMSLGMFIAIISAIRTNWKDRPIMHVHDEYYIWRDGMSNIWYSAEVAGTIIVQCIPILRPLLRDLHIVMTSKALGTGTDRQSVTLNGRITKEFISQDDKGRMETHAIPMGNIDEETQQPGMGNRNISFSSSLPSDTDHHSKPAFPSGPLSSESWTSSQSGHTTVHNPRYDCWIDLEQDGLSPPPHRPART